MMIRRGVSIRRLERKDVEPLLRICNEAISRGESTLGPAPVDAGLIDALLFGTEERFEAYVHEDARGEVVAWAALRPHTGRPVYNVCGELELFVSPGRRRSGLGRALMAHLLDRAQVLNYHTLLLVLQAVPTPPLAWAVRLGFQSVGVLSAVLPVGDEWRDIFVLQKFLEPSGTVSHVS